MIPTRLPTFLAKAAICGMLAGARYCRALVRRHPPGLAAFPVCEVIMAVTTVTPREQIRDALRFVRDSRHHGQCNCFSFRDANREAFCTAQEALWTKAIARLIDECL